MRFRMDEARPAMRRDAVGCIHAFDSGGGRERPSPVDSESPNERQSRGWRRRRVGPRGPLVGFADARGAVGLCRERLSQKTGDTNPIPRVMLAK